MEYVEGVDVEGEIRNFDKESRVQAHQNTIRSEYERSRNRLREYR